MNCFHYHPECSQHVLITRGIRCKGHVLSLTPKGLGGGKGGVLPLQREEEEESVQSKISRGKPTRRRRRGGGAFTIGIAEDDRPGRWCAHRHCTNGQAVSPTTCWVAPAPPNRVGLEGRRLLLSRGSTRGSARSVQWLPEISLPCTRRTRQGGEEEELALLGGGGVV
jgi:hypothetical protein